MLCVEMDRVRPRCCSSRSRTPITPSPPLIQRKSRRPVAAFCGARSDLGRKRGGSGTPRDRPSGLLALALSPSFSVIIFTEPKIYAGGRRPRKSAGRRLLWYLLHLPIGDRGSLRLLRTHECCPEPANRTGAVVHFIGLGDLRRGVVRGYRCIGRCWRPERLHGTSGVQARRPNSLSNGPRPLATRHVDEAPQARGIEGYVYTITLYTSQHLHDHGVRRPLLLH